MSDIITKTVTFPNGSYITIVTSNNLYHISYHNPDSSISNSVTLENEVVKAISDSFLQNNGLNDKTQTKFFD